MVMTDQDVILMKFLDEVKTITNKFPPYNSAHEAYGILKEEVDELWDEIKKKESARNDHFLINEAIQVAAVAFRFAVETEAKRTKAY